MFHVTGPLYSFLSRLALVLIDPSKQSVQTHAHDEARRRYFRRRRTPNSMAAEGNPDEKCAVDTCP